MRVASCITTDECTETEMVFCRRKKNFSVCQYVLYQGHNKCIVALIK